MWPFRKPGVYETTDRGEQDAGIASFDVLVTRDEFFPHAARRLREHLKNPKAEITLQGRRGLVYHFRIYPELKVSDARKAEAL